MKLTEQTVRMFETDQEKFGTKVALFNILWQHSVESLNDLGITRVRTENPDGTEAKPGQAAGKAKAGRNGTGGKARGREKSVRLSG